MTLHLDDARWRAAVEADALGEATDEQRALIAEHAPHGAEYRAEQALLAALADDELSLEGEADDAAIVASAVDEFRGAPALAADAAPTQTGRRGWALALAAVTSVAAAVGIAFLVAPETPEPSRPIAAAPSTPPADEVDPLGPSEPTAPTNEAATGWAIASGRLAGPDAPSDAGVPTGTGLLADAELCLSRGAGRACLNRGARFEAQTDGPLVLHEGRAEVRVEDTAEFAVAMDTVTVEPSRDAVFVIERGVAGWSVHVQSGDVTVVEQSSKRVLRAGETLQRGGKSNSVKPQRDPGPKSSDLLRKARAQRKDGDLDGALSTYRRLTRLHPKSAAARAASVSIGQLYLKRGDADKALPAFRRYLATGAGGLAEDAAYGEIRALRALGRQTEAKSATARFLREYPESHYGAKLRP